MIQKVMPQMSVAILNESNFKYLQITNTVFGVCHGSRILKTSWVVVGTNSFHPMWVHV